MRTTSTGQVEKGYIKNQVTYPKKGLLYLGSETCDQTQDKGDTERPRLKGPALFHRARTRRSDDRGPPPPPVCRLSPLRRRLGERETLFGGDRAQKKGKRRRSRPCSLNARRGGPRSPNARLSHSRFQKQVFQNKWD